MHLPLSLLLFLYTLPSLATNEGDTFHERLKLRDLPDGKLSSTFSFTSRGRLVGEQWGDNVQCTSVYLWQGSGLTRDAVFPSRLLPRSLTSIIRAHNVAEMHLSMAAGRWEDDKWGWPPSNGSASGAEVWAWLDRPDQERCVRSPQLMSDEARCPHSTDKAWSALVNTLGGLFCTSLNRLDATRTTSPALTFRPDGDISPSRHHLRHGLLPLEKPCTENFTPFLALLPCRSAAGLAFLRKPHRIFDADWQRLGVNILRRGDNYEIALDVEIVFDPVRLDRNKGGLGKRGACA
jgi:phosphatidylinositol glycan class T